MAREATGEVPFQAHVGLLRLFMAERGAIVARLQDLLNAQKKPAQYLQDRPLLSRRIDECFFALASITHDQARLRGQLEEAHWAGGFRPRPVPGLVNDLIHPAEMTIRGFYCWHKTRWPGRNGRVRYANTLFDVYLLRSLELLSMRLWDSGDASAGERLSLLQGLIDELSESAPANQPVLVRDARWLIPLAQSPTTDDLAAYFDVSMRIASSFSSDDRLEVRRASVQMIAGHLRSQIRHYCINEDVSLDDPGVVRRTRTSNALDFALLIQGLVPLLDAYERAMTAGDAPARLRFAHAICQGVSPDPELFLNRLDLLGPYSMIEYAFIETDSDGRAAYTPAGAWHVGLLGEYRQRIGRLSKPLSEDCRAFVPREGTYSPYGAIFGTPSNLTEDMALKTLDRDVVTTFSLEDVFSDGESDKLAWVNGWRQLPHIDRQVQALYRYPQKFAEAIYARIESALSRAVSDGEAARTGRLAIGAANDADSGIPCLAPSCVASSDSAIVAAGNAEACDQARLLRDRLEGYYLVSHETSGGWVAVRKDFLTDVLGAGHDAKIARLPATAAEIARLMCPGLAII